MEEKLNFDGKSQNRHISEKYNKLQFFLHTTYGKDEREGKLMNIVHIGQNRWKPINRMK